MIESLRKLGFVLQVDEAARTIRINGQGGKIPAAKADLFCGNSGTTIRFLTALGYVEVCGYFAGWYCRECL